MATNNRDYNLPPAGYWARAELGDLIRANFEDVDTDVQDALDSTATDSDTQSGDGAATTFTIAHSLGAVPSAADVIPTLSAAAAEFYVSDKTDSNVEITYSSAPADATDNLSWDVITVA